MIFREMIVVKAREWADLRVKYQHRGVTRGGCDCSGLPVGILKELGFLQDFVMPCYPPDWNLHNAKFNYLLDYVNKLADEIPINERQPGDLLLFRFGKQISHAGIYIGDDTFVHCYATNGVWYGVLKNSPWGKRLVSAWRLDENKLNEGN